MMKYIILVFILICILGLIEIYRETHTFRVKEHSASLEKLGNGHLTIALLSDLHGRVYDPVNRRLQQCVIDSDPDLIISAGDMMIHREEHMISDMEAFYVELAEKFYALPGRNDGVCRMFYTFGNHEKRGQRYDNIRVMLDDTLKRLEACPMHTLRNEYETITVGGRDYEITGLDIPMDHYRHGHAKPVDGTLLKGMKPLRSEEGEEADTDHFEPGIDIPESAVRILISHHPDIWDFAAAKGYDLTLSGHIHGGMVWLPWIGGLITPQLKIGSRMAKGCFKKDGKVLVVSAGLGDHKKTLRFNNPAELVILHLSGEGEK